MKINKYWAVLIIMLGIYFGLIYSLTYDRTMHWDSARHGVDSFIIYDYLKTITNDGYISWGEFTANYEKIMPGLVGWYTEIDPPFYSLFQALFFMVFGANYITALLTTGLLVLLGIPLFYILSKKILKNEWYALLTVILFLISPIVVYYLPMTMLEIPIALAVIGWYYITFERERKDWSFKYGEKIFSLNRNYLYAALFLSAATMMKYTTMIYYAGFMAAYFCYLLLRKQFQESKELIKIGITQSVMFLVLCGAWLKYVLYDTGIWQRVLKEGTGYARESWLFYFKDTLPQTMWLILLAFIPLIFKEGREFYKENIKIVIFIITTYLIATILINNQQLRYMIQAIPFLYLFIVKGIQLLSFNKLAKILIPICLIVCSSFYAYDVITDRNKLDGKQSYDWIELTKQIQDPKLLVYVHDRKNVSSGYYANPDMSIFGFMMAKKEYNPRDMKQFMQYVYWSSYDNGYEPLLQTFKEWSKQIPIFIYVPKFRDCTDILDKELTQMNFTKIEMQWYNVYGI